MFTTTGILNYDPNRGNVDADWWCVVDIDPDIARYYRWWVYNRYGIVLHKPAWAPHISVIKGLRDKPDDTTLWGHEDGKSIDLEYSHEVYQCSNGTKRKRSDVFWIVDVTGGELSKIRRQFNLPNQWNFHLTVGRTY